MSKCTGVELRVGGVCAGEGGVWCLGELVGSWWPFVLGLAHATNLSV